MFKDGNTTSVPHVLSVMRTNVMLRVCQRVRSLSQAHSPARS